MINEQYLQGAIRIKKTYLKLINQLDEYHKMASESMKCLTKAQADIEMIEDRLKQNRKNKIPDSMDVAVNNIFKVMSDLEEEGNRIERFIDPIKKEIEKLAIEEQILYKGICEAHQDLEEDTIIYIVQARLKQEGLIR